MNALEQRNLMTALQYLELYNFDIDRFVPECYTADCQIHAMGVGVITGYAQFLEVEQAVLRAAPRRRMRLDHFHVVGDAVILEITLLNSDLGAQWELPFVAVLNMREGKIAVDRSYADWARWPGLDNLSGAGAAPRGVAISPPPLGAALSTRAQANLAVAERYVELYNTDPERFVRECYHPDYKVGAMGLGWYDGIDKFVEIEKAVCAAAPQRRMRADCLHVTDTAVVVEAVIVDSSRGATWELPFVAALEIRGDKIAVDRTTAEFAKWPGLEGTI